MRGVTRTDCRVCGRHVSECGPLSARGKCGECGERRMRENHAQLLAHSGPFFLHWRTRSLAALGVVVVDTDRDAA